jgi:hypothetical protein
MELWDRLLTLLRMMRGYGVRHFELNERLPVLDACLPLSFGGPGANRFN